ncbi:hypothetical protein AK830_g4156 [Neonectria ditissima]|uniref:Cyanovirin-N domain-containing protein n=1 Tax=Neonectria ditissima TaxID=78410 RepID=A0A0P7BNQ1_9HYPO|nr:hypothetical protein AK830_g4156 [Neonectria ditissima]
MLLKAHLSSLLAIATTAAAWPGRGSDLIGMYSRAFLGVDDWKNIVPYDATFPAFEDQCDGMQILGEGRAGSLALSGFCIGANKTRYLTELNLNWCFENDDGQLKVAAQPLDNKQIYLAAGCINKAGNFTPTYVKFDNVNTTLSTSVKPVDGRFVCGNHNGTRVAVGNWGEPTVKFVPPGK